MAMLSPPVKAEKCSIRPIVLALAFSSSEDDVRTRSRRVAVCGGFLDEMTKAAS